MTEPKNTPLPGCTLPELLARNLAKIRGRLTAIKLSHPDLAGRITPLQLLIDRTHREAVTLMPPEMWPAESEGE